MDTYKLAKPEGRRKKWQVRGYYKGYWVGTWDCDSEAIARELLKRLKAGKAPGWVAHDLARKMR